MKTLNDEELVMVEDSVSKLHAERSGLLRLWRSLRQQLGKSMPDRLLSPDLLLEHRDPWLQRHRELAAYARPASWPPTRGRQAGRPCYGRCCSYCSVCAGGRSGP